MKCLPLTCLAFLILPAFAPAQCFNGRCSAPVFQQTAYNTSYAATAIVEPVIAAVFQPITVAVPAYAVSYTPYVAPPTPVAPTPAPAAQPAAQPASAPCITPDDLKALRDEIKALRTEVRTLKGGSVAAPVAEPRKEDSAEVKALTVLNNRCAACHSTAHAADGGGLVLLTNDGKLSDGWKSPLTVLKISNSVYAGKMPKLTKAEKAAGKDKPEPLSDPEVGAIMDLIRSLKL